MLMPLTFPRNRSVPFRLRPVGARAGNYSFHRALPCAIDSGLSAHRQEKYGKIVAKTGQSPTNRYTHIVVLGTVQNQCR